MSQSSDPKDRRALLERALRAVEELQGKVDALEREKGKASPLSEWVAASPDMSRDPKPTGNSC